MGDGEDDDMNGSAESPPPLSLETHYSPPVSPLDLASVMSPASVRSPEAGDAMESGGDCSA
eukprot:5101944-Amphidinium_carterae.1